VDRLDDRAHGRRLRQDDQGGSTLRVPLRTERLRHDDVDDERDDDEHRRDHVVALHDGRPVDHEHQRGPRDDDVEHVLNDVAAAVVHLLDDHVAAVVVQHFKHTTDHEYQRRLRDDHIEHVLDHHVAPVFEHHIEHDVEYVLDH